MNIKESGCQSGYQEHTSDAKYCYKVVTESLTWAGARQKCQDDGGDLACFGSEQEKEYLAAQCEGCWVGYNWKDGRFSIAFYFSII